MNYDAVYEVLSGSRVAAVSVIDNSFPSDSASGDWRLAKIARLLGCGGLRQRTEPHQNRKRRVRSTATPRLHENILKVGVDIYYSR